MIASFPMYLRPENQAAHEAYWALIRTALADHGIAAPDRLTHDAPIHATWGRADLVVGQICNYPYRTRFADRVTLIGAGDYGLPDAGPGEYYSVLVARVDDPRSDVAAFQGAHFAYNSADSQSGWAAPRLMADATGTAFGSLIETGGHRASARAVADGRADLASIDAVTWSSIARWDAWAENLRVIARTDATPGLSFITAGDVDPAPYLAAMTDALDALPKPDTSVLGLKSIVAIPKARYLALPIPKAPTA